MTFNAQLAKLAKRPVTHKLFQEQGLKKQTNKHADYPHVWDK